ncbi:MAG: hypothetical protein OSA84_07915 [Akkermansiaceae bacterium]|nr:hypothetical protein [Akkermansiaceae bacterium]
MNPDLDDPNNHVPPISDGDDWDDLDDVSERTRMGLPPRRVDRGLPPKKDQRGAQVNRHTPTLKLEQEGRYDPLKSKDGSDQVKGDQVNDDESGEPEGKRKVYGKSRKADVAKKPATGLGEAAKNEPIEARIELPPAKDGKRFRVHEIDPENDPLVGRPHRQTPKVGSIASDDHDEIGQQRRRFVRGERGDWGGKAGAGSVKWMILTGIGVLGLVVLAVVLSQTPDRKGNRRDQSFYSQLTPAEAEVQDDSDDLKSLEVLTSSEDEAKSIFATFASAKTADELMAIVYEPERNRELIVGKWKPLGMKSGWMPGDDSIWKVLDRYGTRHAILDGRLSDFTNFSAFFRESADGLKLDWKATISYASADFGDLKKGEGDASEVRTWLSLADFYTFAFPEERYRSFRIMSPERNLNLWGYVAKASELDQKLQKLFLPSPITGESQSEIQVILRLGLREEESLSNQWLIEDLVSLNWLDE